MIRVRRDKEREPDAFGAAHRENVDTPPLAGNCRETSGISPGTGLHISNFANVCAGIRA